MRFLFILAVLALTLGGCATTPSLPQLTDSQSQNLWQQRQLQLEPVQNWEIRGRVALFIESEVYNLGMNWTVNPNHSTLKLEAALGQGLIQLEKTDLEVRLSTSEGDSYVGQDSQQVLLESTGWSIPVEGLESWIKGISHPRSPYTTVLDRHGRASKLTQDRWTINFVDYQRSELAQHGNLELPSRIYMKRQDLALKIVIDQWQPEQHIPASDLFPDFSDLRK